MRGQRRAPARPVNPGDETVAGGTKSFHAGQRVLDAQRAARRDAKGSHCVEKGVRSRLALESKTCRFDAIDANVEQVRQASRGKDRRGVPARRDDGGLEAGLAHEAYE